MSDVTAVLLAAGNGTRMKSDLVKVMHPIAGKPMIGHIVDNVRRAGLDDIILVVGYQQERIRAYLGDSVRYAVQAEQLGTGHAVQQAAPLIDEAEGGHVLIMYGDNPFIGPELIQRLIRAHVDAGAAATLLTAEVSNPGMLGRILRDPATGAFLGSVEYKDATPEQRQIREIWPGIVIFRRQGFTSLLGRLDRNNAQREYYLPQAWEILLREGEKVQALLAATEAEALAPNDRVEWARAEAQLRRMINERHMRAGVTIINPDATYIDAEVEIGRDTVIWPFTFLQGRTRIGRNCTIGPMSTIVASTVDDGCVVQQSVVEESYVGPGCRIGPMAHLRPGCELEGEVEVGNYAELKKAKVGRGVKCHHHSYLGDATIGARANIGAGTITANYNGVEKFRTEIGEGAFIGTNVNLIAPISVGDGALVAAGSTVGPRVEIPADALVVERAPVVVKEGRVAKLKAAWRARKEKREGV
ncbi:bifunctional UDP-N-acetylglucosamine pyrophosphorylase/glucosamine-1-phosphate N-acetyltransferase [Symbiobacterium terraclitae]|uniref:Bifunctional protein GlmU n=1 Tax=Symbiobacterium terraclitae TaxID=557451 RepID=A0ABS4JWL4_9FIRM|nr:bifunctional UDP-N-acetylglucosamine diphosphorylase/glucosamine-1-phosphate N-acetyltransferase GlmU [Symbiobacterium terraclitae]MBP2019901.1 bifunctional UDP-N-acetylglucosamine pyrophosphorylase/glucosamine-1-phosphate N-acetyltransferase [Symbiobacterium terraclitae]